MTHQTDLTEYEAQVARIIAMCAAGTLDAEQRDEAIDSLVNAVSRLHGSSVAADLVGRFVTGRGSF